MRFGSRELRFLISRGRGRAVAITVHPDMRIEVRAPAHVGLDFIERCVRKRGAWITKQLLRLEALPLIPGRRRYVSGKTFGYLGREYRLKVDRGRQSGVLLRRPFLHATVFDHPSARVDRLVQRWYQEQVRAVLTERLKLCLASSPAFIGLQPSIQLRRMPRRWGSCTRAGVISLHAAIIQASLSAIDYVITHELCHLRVLSHKPEFYRVLSRVMPDWRRRRQRLMAVSPAL